MVENQEHILPLVRSARIYLWPFIIINCEAVVIGLGAGEMEGCFIGFMLCALASFGFLINDIWDRPIDRFGTRPKLQTASADLISRAAITSGVFLTIGLSIGFVINDVTFLLAIGISACLVLYTLVVRRYLLISNILAGVLSSSPLWLPLVTIGSVQIDEPKWILVGVALSQLIAREVILDIRDRLADARGGRHTLPTVYGNARAYLVAFLFSLLAIILIATMTIQAINQDKHLESLVIIILSLTMGALIILPSIRLRRNNFAPHGLQQYLLSTKLTMILLPLMILLG